MLNQQKTALLQTLGMSLESRLIVTMLNYDDDPIKVCESTKQGQNPPNEYTAAAKIALLESS